MQTRLIENFITLAIRQTTTQTRLRTEAHFVVMQTVIGPKLFKTEYNHTAYSIAYNNWQSTGAY